MRLAGLTVFLSSACWLIAAGPAVVAQETVRLGSGSYATVPPPGSKSPPRTINQTEAIRGKMPTNDWWSSLAWAPFSAPHYPHPLAVQTEKTGLRVFYPGSRIFANQVGVFGSTPEGGRDLILGHTAQAEFPDARVDGFSDWFVSVRFASEGRSMRLSYGHGSPFVFARYEGGNARLSFLRPPKVWAGGADGPVLGISIDGRHYGLFGPSGSTWTGLGSTTLSNRSEKSYFSLALLPDDSKETLGLFGNHAHAHVTDTRIGWSYEPKTSLVTTTFQFTTEVMEGKSQETLFALYPHQWRNSRQERLGPEYQSVRGAMPLARGDSFRTSMRFQGVLPCLPNVGGADRDRIAAFIKAEVDAKAPPTADTYWEGKRLGKIATLVPIAEAYGLEDSAAALTDALRRRLEGWFTATADDGRPKSAGLFCYDNLWGTVIGYPASYGSDTELNDHHFHHGYFIKAAAEVAMRDPAWGRKDRWGGMVDLLIRDIACSDRRDRQFPFLRNFDPYAGHSWASGHARFGDGNNNESSSEVMNAWTGLILWGEATGDVAVRDLGIALYTNEMTAINEYWFDVEGRNRPRSYTPSVATMIWGGKGTNETWFTKNPEAVHGINWLPIHGGSLYLGQSPAYVARNYAALVSENRGTDWDEWADLVWMYRALADPDDAMKQFEAAASKAKTPTEAGNSRANTYHWIASLQKVGQVDASVTADDPLSAAFRKGRARTYCVYSMTDRPRVVVFSDGTRVRVKGKGFAVERVEK